MSAQALFKQESTIKADKHPEPVADNTTPESEVERANKEQTTLLSLKKSLQKKKDFPAMGKNMSELMQLEQGNDSAEQLSEIILRDQSLSSKILSIVNSSLYSQFGGEITTISRAVVILGLKQIQSLSISIMLFEKLNNGTMTEILRSNACQSFLSASFAKKLTQKSKSIDSEQAFLASMFHNLGKQITIYFLPDEYKQVLNLMIEKGMDEESASKRVFGIGFADIGQYIACEWELPKNVINGIQAKPSKPTVKPATIKEHLSQLSTLTNEIIEAAGCGNTERANNHLKLIMQRYQASFHLEYNKLMQMLEYLQHDLISYCESLAIDYKNNTFCNNYLSFVKHDFTQHKTPEKKDSPVKGEDKVVSQKGFHEAALCFGIAKLSGLLYQPFELTSALTIVVNSLHRGLDCEHVMLLLPDTDKQKMRAEYGAGINMGNIMKQFGFDIIISDDVFNTAIENQQDIFIPDVAHSPLLEKIPDWCKKTTLPRNLLIYPMFNKQQCIGLLYIDNALVISSESKKALDYVNTLRLQATEALIKAI